ncbi:lysylphosphatidylglycerol synthetase [Heyndrickxia shackletonii]|uniref:Phosphatidylglycerol lysyltransferase n=1 Tax=Heyndrickxia shackletonii TaxID=157838 RepID=A0A0Q3TK04_9BACI|nr:lysylphosphatidylglycerol synthetase [Heyndrickxia shackletonii]NEY97870.1 bifunctional lysylphosphatidylglycerol flippase/synthetase MprF [Heyndrickxia shackletonii]
MESGCNFLKLNKKVLNTLKFLFPVLLLLFIFLESRKMIKNFDINLIKNHLDQLNVHNIIIIIILGIIAVTPMLFYDLVLNRILNLGIPKLEMAKYSLTINTYSNFIGFGGVAGLSLRTYFFKGKFKDRGKLVKNIAQISLFYLAGLSILSWIVSLGIMQTSFLAGMKWIKLAVWGISLYAPILILLTKLRERKDQGEHFKTIYILELALISIFEWMFAILLFLTIANILHIHITLRELFPIFIVASCAGIVSMIPGGIGSFDLIMLLGFESLHVPTEKILLILLFYRISYYIIPFILGTILFVKKLWNDLDEPYRQVIHFLARNISHWIITILVFFSGIILLISASLPGVLERVKFLREFLSFPIMNLSHQLSVAAGLLLLFLSRGIEYRVKWAYYFTMFMLIFAAILSITKNLNYEQAIFLIIVAFILWLSKKSFYRINFVVTWGRAAFDFLGILFFIILYFFIGYMNLPQHSEKMKIPHFIRKYMILDPGDLFKSAVLGLIIALIVIYFVYWLKKPYEAQFQSSINETEKIMEHLQKYGGTVLSHLIFLHDKMIYWSRSGNVLFAFQKYADKLVVLGNPVGDHREFHDCIEEFHDVANLYGYTPVYYEVTKEMLPMLHENGYDFFKLGEEAFVNVEEFSLSGKKMKNLRAVKNKLEREGFSCNVLEPPFSDELLTRLQFISEQWLQGRLEKGFSLGFFDKDYLNLGPIAVVKNEEGVPIAFTSLMPKYDDHKTLSLDLMRQLSDIPPGIMDFMFIHLFEWAGQNGYSQFNIGMAPLANVGLSKYSFLGEKLASQIYLHGSFIYHFKGLKNFKEKYADTWEPKYMAYRKKTSLPLTMFQVALLIAKKRPKTD